jgi:hypothetical protein
VSEEAEHTAENRGVAECLDLDTRYPILDIV